MTSAPLKNLYTIPPGAEFLPTFARSILDGSLFPKFRYDPNEPHQLSDIRIYVPTRRAARSLRSELADQIGKQSVILPDIRALGEADEDLGFFETSHNDDLSNPDVISNIQSKLVLGELILLWKQALPKAFHQQLKSVPMVAPANPTDAIWLADELLSLIESAESEEIDLSLIDQIDAEDHAQWWQLTLEFLKILREFWPARLRELGRQSVTRKQIDMLDRQAAELSKDRHNKPVIVAGSTGSLPATARLIKAVSELENGAVILPGLDQNMSAEQWRSIYQFASNKTQLSDSFDLTSVVIQGHPQFGLARLLSRLSLKVDDFFEIKELAKPEHARDNRQKIVSKALLPVSETQIWANHNDIMPADELKAFAGVSLIEADNQREEAAALATAIRLALEPTEDENNPNVALITPDRNLARKISIELIKYGIIADDSGGISLHQTKLGSLPIIFLNVLFKAKDNLALAALIKHPCVLMGMEDENQKRAASVIERLVLRAQQRRIEPKEISNILAEKYQSLPDERHLPEWLRNISDEDLEVALTLADKVSEIFSGFSNIMESTDDVKPIGQWTRATIDALEMLTRSADETFSIWDSEEGSQLVNLLEEVESCPTSLAVSGLEWCDMLEPLLSGQSVKPTTGNHPRVMIWGALEARLQNVDTMILAGLNEGTWPSVGSNDPFLSRSMKSEIGLIPPERRLGLAAHDFQMALGSRKVILSRSLKSSGAPTVASRWIQRMLTVLRAETVKDISKRGADILSFSNQIPQVEKADRAKRPEPKPEAKYQPTNYSFSEVSTLRRDPYAIYARRILNLDPMEDFASEPDLRLRGTIYHAILEKYAKGISAITDKDHLSVFQQIMDDEFSKYDLPIETRLLWKHRLQEVSQYYVEWEAEKETLGVKRNIELSAKCELPGGVGVTLFGRADRIDIDGENNIDIIDFKTGTRPSAKEARSLLDPQLPLEAFALKQGGFGNLGPLSADSLKYVRLKPSDQLIVDQVEQKPTRQNADVETATELGERAARELASIVTALHANKVGYLSRAIPVSEFDISGDYDHLARVSEWSVAEKSGADASDD